MCANVFVAGHLGDNRSAIIANLKGQIAKLRCQITELQHLNEMNRQKLLNMQQSERDFRGYVQALMEKVTVRKNDMANLRLWIRESWIQLFRKLVDKSNNSGYDILRL